MSVNNERLTRRSFDLGIYLKSFIREDLLAVYEAECLKIIDKYEGKSIANTLAKMFAEFNEALTKLGERALETKQKESNASKINESIVMSCYCGCGAEPCMEEFSLVETPQKIKKERK